MATKKKAKKKAKAKKAKAIKKKAPGAVKARKASRRRSDSPEVLATAELFEDSGCDFDEGDADATHDLLNSLGAFDDFS